MVPARIAAPATPPTTPPAIAPALEEPPPSSSGVAVPEEVPEEVDEDEVVLLLLEEEEDEVMTGGAVARLDSSRTERGTSSMVTIVGEVWQRYMDLGVAPGQRYVMHAPMVEVQQQPVFVPIPEQTPLTKAS